MYEMELEQGNKMLTRPKYTDLFVYLYAIVVMLYNMPGSYACMQYELLFIFFYELLYIFCYHRYNTILLVIFSNMQRMVCL